MDSSDAVANFPPEQRAIRDSCFHPAGTFTEFKQAEIDQSVCNRFEQQVAKYPDRIAVRTTRHTLTYEELNRASNRIARAILDRSAAVQQPIAVLFDHGARFVIASLGVLKAGNVQVSLESGFPQARLRYVLEQSKAAALVIDNANLTLARRLGDIPLINIDEIGDRFPDGIPAFLSVRMPTLLSGTRQAPRARRRRLESSRFAARRDASHQHVSCVRR
jgi:non-ribosomal peptide synthetase component F